MRVAIALKMRAGPSSFSGSASRFAVGLDRTEVDRNETQRTWPPYRTVDSLFAWKSVRPFECGNAAHSASAPAARSASVAPYGTCRPFFQRRSRYDALRLIRSHTVIAAASISARSVSSWSEKTPTMYPRSTLDQLPSCPAASAVKSSSAAPGAPLVSRHWSSACSRLSAAIHDDLPAPLLSVGPWPATVTRPWPTIGIGCVESRDRSTTCTPSSTFDPRMSNGPSSTVLLILLLPY